MRRTKKAKKVGTNTLPKTKIIFFFHSPTYVTVVLQFLQSQTPFARPPAHRVQQLLWSTRACFNERRFRGLVCWFFVLNTILFSVWGKGKQMD